MAETAQRWILHCDCNSFFASVELLEHPELQDKPVAVCGSTDDRHGIILAKNEAAKKYGIQTAETVWQAKRKCPVLQLLAPHMHKYRAMSQRINAIYARYTDLVEPFSVDESWLDVTHSYRLFAPGPVELADAIRAAVRRETGVTISVGVSFTKVFAKLGSDFQKPDATTFLPRQAIPTRVWPLPASELLFVGRHTAAALRQHGIATIGQLAAAPPAYLEGFLGKMGLQLSQAARGENDSPVTPYGYQEEPKSVGNGMTFRRDLVSGADIRLGVGVLADSVAARLRRAGKRCTAVQVILKDVQLRCISRQCQLPYATDLEQDIAAAALRLVAENWPEGKPIRMLTVTAMHLTEEELPAQTEMLKPPPVPSAKRARLERAMDAIRQKHGQGSLVCANVLGNDIGVGAPAAEADDEAADPAKVVEGKG